MAASTLVWAAPHLHLHTHSRFLATRTYSTVCPALCTVAVPWPGLHSPVLLCAFEPRRHLPSYPRCRLTTAQHLTLCLSMLCSLSTPAADEDVEVAQPNFIYTASQTTNDPGLNQLWGMLASGGGANAVGAWTAGNTDCSDVVIGIIGKQATTAAAVASVAPAAATAAGATAAEATSAKSTG